MKTRCAWASVDDPLYTAYHDDEWGRPERDSRALFEKLMLDGFQAGLAWITILRKRDGFRSAFAGFDPAKIARFGARDVTRLLGDAGIVRHRGKIEATISNAKAYLAMEKAGEDFSKFCWSFVDGKPQINSPKTLADIRPVSDESKALSKELKKRGFKFVGPTIVYAWMQACGLVNDHMTSCFRYGKK